MSTPFSTINPSGSHTVSIGSTGEVSEPSSKCWREESPISAASHHELVITFKQSCETYPIQPSCSSFQPGSSRVSHPTASRPSHWESAYRDPISLPCLAGSEVSQPLLPLASQSVEAANGHSCHSPASLAVSPHVHWATGNCHGHTHHTAVGSPSTLSGSHPAIRGHCGCGHGSPVY